MKHVKKFNEINEIFGLSKDGDKHAKYIIDEYFDSNYCEISSPEEDVYQIVYDEKKLYKFKSDNKNCSLTVSNCYLKRDGDKMKIIVNGNEETYEISCKYYEKVKSSYNHRNNIRVNVS